MPLQRTAPVLASFPSEYLTIAAGVAIFHLASQRVVLCYHTRDHYYFLPKGRRNANETTGQAAEREGFEESGYRNRLLPLPLLHRQPDADEGHEEFVTEPVWTQLLPLSSRTQYLLHWYIAETVTSNVENDYRDAYVGNECRPPYKPPPPYPKGQTLLSRIDEDLTVVNCEEGKREVYEPVRRENTGVDEEEALYESCLVSIEEARRLLRKSSAMDIIDKGWGCIQLRLQMEKGKSAGPA
jgi:8-oxo-dGTP pyrophosphatase MutT (NUDIX family)